MYEPFAATLAELRGADLRAEADRRRRIRRSVRTRRDARRIRH